MSMFNQVVLRDGLSSGQAFSPSHAKQARTLAFCACLTSLLLVLAAFGIVVTTPALAAGTSPGAGPIAFYGDLGNDLISQDPSLRDPSTFLVRPSSLLLAEDGSASLENLRWSGWGTSVARATGTWRASDCTPSCANGKDAIGQAQLTLSSPGIVLGHLVYRCFRITPSHPQSDMADQGCLHRNGTYQGHDHYGYQ